MRSGQLVLLVLAISAFCIGTTEFGMAGILPEIAKSFSVSIPVAGWLMTGYAIGVSVSAPIITAITIGLARKNVLIVLLVIFILGNIISAIASSYTALMFGRVLASLCHGAFFGVGSVVAINSVAPKNHGMAVAVMFSGLTLANLIGVPIGTFLGQKFGYASIFYIVAVLGAIALLGVILFVPAKEQNTRPIFKNELNSFKNVHIWLLLFVTAFGFGGVFAFFAYIAPIMMHTASFGQQDIVWLLFVFGVGLIIGNIIGGKAADYALTKSIVVFLISLIVMLIFFTITIHIKPMTIMNVFVIGVLCFAISSPIQTQVMTAAKNAPNIASAANISAFNAGIAIGTYLGGLAIHLGLGYISVNLVGAGMVTLALVVQLLNVGF